MSSITDKITRSIKLYPWFAGLSLDLIFYIAFSTIWLVDVKGFNAAQVTFLATISGISAILLQVPTLHLTKRIGTTSSIRLSALCLLLCSVIITISDSYLGFIIGQICFVAANLFGAMGNVLIKNNLDHIHEGRRFPELASKSCVIYSAATMITSLIVGALFSCWQYLPMVLGIITCIIVLILSFCIEDVTESSKTLSAKNVVALSIKRSFPRPIKTFIALLLFYAFTYGLIATAQTDGKLFIQSELSSQLTIDDVATIFGIIIFTSRALRLFCDLIYPKVYQRLRDRVTVLFPVMVLLAISLILLGFALEIDFYLKIVLMTFGFSILPSLRDPFRIYCENLCLQRLQKSYQKDALLYLNVARRCGELVVSGLASIILLRAPLEYVFISFSLLTLPVIVYSLKVRRLFHKRRSRQKT